LRICGMPRKTGHGIGGNMAGYFELERVVPGMIKHKWLLICLVLPGLVMGNAVASDAQSRLDAMANTLASAKHFSVNISMSYDVVQDSGQKIQFSEIREVKLSRPNQLRVDSRQSDGTAGGLVFDGKTLTLFNTDENVYSQTLLTGNIDTAVRYAVGELGIRVPLARMLVTTLPDELKKLSSKVDYVEQNTLADVPTDHIAGRGRDVDYQVWIAKDNLPRRIVITYKNEPGQPQFHADFSGWNLSSTITVNTFAYTPAKDAEKIPVFVPARQSQEVGKEQGAVR
jgi:hypothetical protein